MIIKDLLGLFGMHVKLVKKSVLPWLFITLSASLLSACQDDAHQDLQEFFAQETHSVPAKIEPLPTVKLYTPSIYNADGSLHDPFKPRKAATPPTVQANMSRRREPLEAFPLENLKFVGALIKNKLRYALIKQPDNIVQQVALGNHLGQDSGQVTQITERNIKVKELIQDEATGVWTNRLVELTLQD